MSNVDGLGVPFPSNDNVWENWVSHLLTTKFGRPANAYGRNGQKQDGIDFIVYDGDVRVGVQCKFVTHGSKLNVKQVEKDYKASHSIKPAISRFVLYTSAASDPKTVNALDSIKAEVKTSYPEFSFLMWRDFEAEVQKYDLFKRLYSDEALAPASIPVESPGQAVSKPIHEANGVQTATTVHSGSAALYSGILDDVKEYSAAGNFSGADALVDQILKRKDSIPDTELARAYATKAVLLSRAGNILEAAGFWRKSAEIEPSPDLRHGRRAQALLCEDRYEEALTAAIPGLQTQPPSSLSAIVALICGQRLGRRSEIDAQLSGRLKSERDIGLVRAHMAMADGEFELSKEITEVLAKDYSNDTDLTALRADLLLHEALGGVGQKRSEIVSGSARRALEAAVPLYRSSLDKRDPVREKSGWYPAALNFISVLKLLGKHEDAAEVAANIFDKLGSDVGEFDRLILVLAEGDRELRALEMSAERNPASAMVKLARASALMNLGRFKEAENVLEEIGPVDADINSDNIGWMLVAVRMQTRSDADITTLASEYYNNAHNKLAACNRIFENGLRLGHRQLADQYAEKAIELYQDNPNPDFLLLIADAFIRLDKKNDALKLLLPQIDLDRPQGGPLEERLAFCLLHLRRLESLGKLLNGLPEDATDSVRFDPYRVEYQLARGDRPSALKAIRDSLGRNSSDLKLHALEVTLLREAGDREGARKKLEMIQYQSNASLGAVARYVNEARELDADEKADDLSYRWIREHSEVPENAAWFLASVLKNKKILQPSAPLIAVTRQCGVCLKSTTRGTEAHWIVIDDRYPERIAGGWLAPHSKNISDVIGKSLGATIEFNSFPDGPFIIESIVPTYEGAYRLMQSRYGRELPMTSALQLVPVEGANGQFDFSPIFKVLDNSKKAALHAFSVYAEGTIPIGMLANAMGRHPIDVWAALVGTDRHVRAMSGDAQSAEEFSKRLSGGIPNIVLDPLTLISWDTFGLLPIALKAVGSISMTVSAVEIIRTKREEFSGDDDRPHMTLAASERDGFYERTEITSEMVSSQREVFDRVLQWIEAHATVVPVPPSGLSEDFYSAIRMNCPAYLADSMQLAAHEGRVLVVDDLGLEQLSLASRVSQVPTVALLRSARAENRITEEEWCKALVQFSKANYEFISFSADDIYSVTDISADTITPDASAMLRYLQIKSLDLMSGLTVVSEYLKKLAESRVPPKLFASSLVLSLSILSRHATRETQFIYSLMAHLSRKYRARGYADAANGALNIWLIGHFLSEQEVLIPIGTEPSVEASALARHKNKCDKHK